MAKCLMAIGIILALCSVAHADLDPLVYYSGSRCFRIDKEGEKAGQETIKEPTLLQPTRYQAALHKDRRDLGLCKSQLTTCRADTKPPSQVWLAVKWGGYGAGLALAFIAGAVLL